MVDSKIISRQCGKCSFKFYASILLLCLTSFYVYMISYHDVLSLTAIYAANILEEQDSYREPVHRQLPLYDNILDNPKAQDLNSETEHKQYLPPNCTEGNLSQIRRQLPPDWCIKTRNRPWTQRCSFTKATGCIRATWLTDYYINLHKNVNHSKSLESFLGISVGCNKGFDAMETMRMGTANKKFDKKMWHEAMHDDRADIPKPNCPQERNVTDQFDIRGDFTDKSHGTMYNRAGEMHCIEALPANYNRMKHSAEKLSMEHDGFIVKNAALLRAPEKETISFPSGENSTIGVENLSLSDCKRNEQWKLDNHFCQVVEAFSLDTYVEKHVQSKGPIHILNIDVEGYDFDVMMGGKESVLDRVHYLEFEYNWGSPWKGQKLSDAIEMLNEYGFSCYWAGDDRLWRITGCWQEYYDIHHWGNVACTHHSQKELLENMEEIFRRTLELEEVW